MQRGLAINFKQLQFVKQRLSMFLCSSVYMFVAKSAQVLTKVIPQVSSFS